MSLFSCIYPFWKRQSRLSTATPSGFTLIELMIVLVITSVLGTMMYPMVISQIGKARAAEAKNGLGSLGRAQQAYLFEYGEFAQSINDLEIEFTLGNNQENQFTTKYYTYSVDGVPTDDEVHHQAIPIRGAAYNTRVLVSAVFHKPTFFTTVICEASQPTALPSIVDPDTCSNGRFIN